MTTPPTELTREQVTAFLADLKQPGNPNVAMRRGWAIALCEHYLATVPAAQTDELYCEKCSRFYTAANPNCADGHTSIVPTVAPKVDLGEAGRIVRNSQDTASGYGLMVTWVLAQILDSLPQRRDWLDPDLEKIARTEVAAHKKHAAKAPKVEAVAETLVLNDAGNEVLIEKRKDGKWEFFIGVCGKPTFVPPPSPWREKLLALADVWKLEAQDYTDSYSRAGRVHADELRALVEQMGKGE